VKRLPRRWLLPRAALHSAAASQNLHNDLITIFTVSGCMHRIWLQGYGAVHAPVSRATVMDALWACWAPGTSRATPPTHAAKIAAKPAIAAGEMG